MIGEFDSNHKYSKPSASRVVRVLFKPISYFKQFVSSSVHRLCRRTSHSSSFIPSCCGGGGSGSSGLIAGDERRSNNRSIMSLSVFCVFLLLCLVYVRVDVAAKDSYIAKLESLSQTQQEEIMRHIDLLAAAQTSLLDTTGGDVSRAAAPLNLQADFASSETLAHSLQKSLDHSMETGWSIKERLTALQNNMANIERGTLVLQDKLHQHEAALSRLSIEKSSLASSLTSCLTRVNSSREVKESSVELVQENLVQMQQQLAKQKRWLQQQVDETSLALHATDAQRLNELVFHTMDAAIRLRQDASLDRQELGMNQHVQKEQEESQPQQQQEQQQQQQEQQQHEQQQREEQREESKKDEPAAGISAEQVSASIKQNEASSDQSAHAEAPPDAAEKQHTEPASSTPAAAAASADADTSLKQSVDALRKIVARIKPRRRHSTPPVPEDPNHPENQVHFVGDKPLHDQPDHLRPDPMHDDAPATPFPLAYKSTGIYGALALNMPPEVQLQQAAIRDEFMHAWQGYKKWAWGFDELHPISRAGRNSQYYMSLTMIDALDTIIVMGIEEEYHLIRNYLAEYLIFTEQEDINVFETTIRVIGGLLSAYAMSSDTLFLHKARECADGLLVAFQTPTGLPLGTVGLRTKVASNPAWSAGSSTMSEVGSIQMEWQYLSRVTGDPIYEQKVDAVTKQLRGLQKSLYPQFINVDTAHLSNQIYTFGARVDSIYEYFLKQYLLSGKRKDVPLEMYIDSMHSLENVLVKEARGMAPGEENLTYIAEMHGSVIHGKMDHLVCFVPGMLALGAYSKAVNVKDQIRHMELAKKLMKTCYLMYSSNPTGLAAEISQFNLDLNAHEPGMKVDPNAHHNMLRPETVESLFIMWRVTKDPIYREWGWKIFESIRKYCRVEEAGYSGLKDVRISDRPTHDASANWHNWNDKMESFFLSETMKYLYLLFSPDELISLDEWVFNTEAHPLPIDHDDGSGTRVEASEQKSGEEHVSHARKVLDITEEQLQEAIRLAQLYALEYQKQQQKEEPSGPPAAGGDAATPLSLSDDGQHDPEFSPEELAQMEQELQAEADKALQFLHEKFLRAQEQAAAGISNSVPTPEVVEATAAHAGSFPPATDLNAASAVNDEVSELMEATQRREQEQQAGGEQPQQQHDQTAPIAADHAAPVDIATH